MFTVRCGSHEKSYYEVFDALTVAEIEVASRPEYDWILDSLRLAYIGHNRSSGHSLSIEIIDHSGNLITLRPLRERL